MFDSIRICLHPLENKAKSFLHRLRSSVRRAVVSAFARGPKPEKRESSPRGVLSAQLRQVFDLIDSNRDGKISPSELGTVLSHLDGYSKTTALDEARAMVREMDRDGDGLVDLEEFMEAVTDGGGKAADRKEEEEEECLREAFSIYDSNGDGRISAEELRRVLAGLGISKCSIRDCRSMIGGCDRDGDGYVDFEEFRHMMMVNSSTTGFS